MRKKLIPAACLVLLGACQPDTPQQQAATAPPPAPVAAPAPVPTPAAPVAAPAPVSNDPLELARSYGCLVCHAIDKKTIGPAWKDVAAKYRGDKGAEAKLMDKVLKGGVGVWGNVAMPPNPKPSEEQRRKIVRFILGLK